jgi:predicted transposase YdaD
MGEKSEAAFSRTQPYDTSFKAILDDITLEILSYLLGEEIIFAEELKESLFKQNTLKPPLRVDCAYKVRSRQREQVGVFVLHVEVETAPTPKIPVRLWEYAAMLHNKYDLPVLQLLLCPFETPNLPIPPYQVKLGEEVMDEHRYRAEGLWLREARELIEQKRVLLYVLLPTMKGVTYEMLVQALRDIRAFFAADESRLCNHLLWFDALLGRTTQVAPEDKGRVRHVMLNEFHSLLDEGYFVQLRREEGRQEGLQEGLEEGVVKGREEGVAIGREEGLTAGLQEALTTAVELRFPALLDLAQERAKQARTAEKLRLAVKGIKVAPNEEGARVVLDLLAA